MSENALSIVKEIGNKIVTNGQRIENKPIAESVTNRKQIENGKNPIEQNQQQIDNKTSNIIGNKVVTNRKQTKNEATEKISFSEGN